MTHCLTDLQQILLLYAGYLKDCGPNQTSSSGNSITTGKGMNLCQELLQEKKMVCTEQILPEGWLRGFLLVRENVQVKFAEGGISAKSLTMKVRSLIWKDFMLSAIYL